MLRFFVISLYSGSIKHFSLSTGFCCSVCVGIRSSLEVLPLINEGIHIAHGRKGCSGDATECGSAHLYLLSVVEVAT